MIKLRGLKLATFLPENEFNPSLYLPEGTLHRIKDACLNLPCGSILAVDGWPRSGKSPTARWLQLQLGWELIHLDNFNCPPNGLAGFDEQAMKVAVRKVSSLSSVIVEGVCAGRICDPDILVHLGPWPGPRLLKSTMKFIGSYHPEEYTGKNSTFYASFGETHR